MTSAILKMPLRRLWHDQWGTVALEFALVLPVMAIMMLGMVEVWILMTANRQIQSVANSIAQMLSQSTATTVTSDDLIFVTDSTMVLFPGVLANSHKKGIAWSEDINVTISSVLFTQVNGGFTTQVVWSRGPNKRPCGVNSLSAADDTAAPSPTTLPADSFAAGSLIVVDVKYTDTPALLSNVFPTMHFAKSAYLQPRYVTPYIGYNSKAADDDGKTTVCPGF